MKFLMLVVTDTDTEPDPTGAPTIEDWGSYVDEHGHWIAGDRLRPANEAKTVRVRRGQVELIDGPSVDTAGQIVGFDVLECADLQQAVEIAQRHRTPTPARSSYVRSGRSTTTDLEQPHPVVAVAPS